jgi:DNA-directed RNA polymerase specialized sigma24 family protein
VPADSRRLTLHGSSMTDGSVTHWIGQVKEASDSIAERELWDRYFSRLAALARQKLHDLPPHLRDDEDLALSALDSFFTRARQDGFPRLHDRTDLWRLLAKITVRKAIDRRRTVKAQKRGAGKVHGNSVFGDDLLELARSDPTPDMVLAINEQYQRLMGALIPGLQNIARMKLEGYTNREIATKLGRVERTIERKLERIRNVWLKEVERS